MKTVLERVLIHAAGTPCMSVRTLAEPEVAALLAHYVRGEDSAVAQRCLEAAWRERQWFACRCRAPGQQPPLLFARQPVRGEYVLAPMPDRPPHAAGCPLACEAAVASASPATPALPMLAQLLFRWISGARLNVLYPYDCADLLHTQYLALRETAKSLQIAPGRRLYDYSRTHTSGLAELCRRLRSHHNDTAINEPIWGAYLAIVPSLKPAAISAALGAHASELHRPDAPVMRLPNALDKGGPQVVLFVLMPTVRGEAVRVERIFAHPVYSRGLLIPVDSAHARRTLTALLAVQRRILASHQLVMTIRKTLPDTTVHERGIAFQVGVLGPNGQALRQLDVVSVNAGELDSAGVDGCSCPRTVAERDAGGTVLYHAARVDDAPIDTDQLFMTELTARLLEPMSTMDRLNV